MNNTTITTILITIIFIIHNHTNHNYNIIVTQHHHPQPPRPPQQHQHQKQQPHHHHHQQQQQQQLKRPKRSALKTKTPKPQTFPAPRTPTTPAPRDAESAAELSESELLVTIEILQQEKLLRATRGFLGFRVEGTGYTSEKEGLGLGKRDLGAEPTVCKQRGEIGFECRALGKARDSCPNWGIRHNCASIPLSSSLSISLPIYLTHLSIDPSFISVALFTHIFIFISASISTSLSLSVDLSIPESCQEPPGHKSPTRTEKPSTPLTPLTLNPTNPLNLKPQTRNPKPQPRNSQLRPGSIAGCRWMQISAFGFRSRGQAGWQSGRETPSIRV